jgi:hypothetical protein
MGFVSPATDYVEQRLTIDNLWHRRKLPGDRNVMRMGRHKRSHKREQW